MGTLPAHSRWATRKKGGVGRVVAGGLGDGCGATKRYVCACARSCTSCVLRQAAYSSTRKKIMCVCRSTLQVEGLTQAGERTAGGRAVGGLGAGGQVRCRESGRVRDCAGRVGRRRWCGGRVPEPEVHMGRSGSSGSAIFDRLRTAAGAINR